MCSVRHYFVNFVSLGACSLILLNVGQGLFTDSGQLLDIVAQRILLLDLDDNDTLDAVTTNRQVGNPIWLNNGAGIFTNSGVSLDEPQVFSITGCDVDLDGRRDVIIGKLEENGKGARHRFVELSSATDSSPGSPQTQRTSRTSNGVTNQR